MDAQSQRQLECENCNKEIDSEKIDLHQAYCFRNVVKCQKCHMPIDKNNIEEHDDEYHNLIPCQNCSRKFLLAELQHHQGKCSKIPKKCHFCELFLDHTEFAKHVQQCGSRTQPCKHCGKYQIIQFLQLHELSCVEQQQKQRQENLLIQNNKQQIKNCNRTVHQNKTTKHVPQQKSHQNKRRIKNQLEVDSGSEGEGNMFDNLDNESASSEIEFYEHINQNNKIVKKQPVEQTQINNKHKQQKMPPIDKQQNCGQNLKKYLSKKQNQPENKSQNQENQQKIQNKGQGQNGNNRLGTNFQFNARKLKHPADITHMNDEEMLQRAIEESMGCFDNPVINNGSSESQLEAILQQSLIEK